MNLKIAAFNTALLGDAFQVANGVIRCLSRWRTYPTSAPKARWLRLFPLEQFGPYVTHFVPDIHQ